MRTISHVISDVGRVRDENEDNYFIDDKRSLYVVADGMGGHASGEVASRICVESVEAAYGDQSVEEAWRERHREAKNAGRVDKDFSEYALQGALEYANEAIFGAARRNPDQRDMGTTAVALHVNGSVAYVGHVGDSRVYRLRQGDFVQLSEDHSLANEYVRMKLLRREDVPRFVHKNVIVRALGLTEQVVVDTQERSCEVGDRFLLCSDGLTDLVSDDSIAEALGTSEFPEEACQTLVAQALRQGGIDNITVVCVWAQSDDENEE